MLFNSLEMGSAEDLALSHIERRQQELVASLRVPRRWIGLFRRQTLARASQASMQLSGLAAGLDDVLAALDGDEPFDTSGELRAGLVAYRDAWTYICQMAGPSTGNAAQPATPAALDPSTLRSMHFVLMHHLMDHDPGVEAGRWRSDGEPGPAALVDDLTARLAADTNHPLVRGALAHLWVAVARPFAAGNGRMARLAHAMVLQSHPPIDALYTGIDEYLATNPGIYQAVLAEVADGSGRWAGDPTPWIRFCLTAHYRQSAKLIDRLQDAEKLWATCTLLAVDHDVPVRCVGALSEAAQGLRLRNATYRRVVKLSESADQGDVTEQTASRDLKALVDCGLLNYVGEKRARIYRGGVMLRAAWAQVRSQRQNSQRQDSPGQGPASDDPLAPDFLP